MILEYRDIGNQFTETVEDIIRNYLIVYFDANRVYNSPRDIASANLDPVAILSCGDSTATTIYDPIADLTSGMGVS